MASTYTPLKIELMATGENDGTWGAITNQNFLSFEQMITGQATVTFASADQTLTLTDTNALQTARALRLVLIGTTGGAPRNLIVPNAAKLYSVFNTCNEPVTIKNAVGTGVTIPGGFRSALVYNDGSNVGDCFNFVSNLLVGSGGLSSSISGLLKGNGSGSAITAGVAGVDYAHPGVASTWSASQAFNVVQFFNAGLTSYGTALLNGNTGVASFRIRSGSEFAGVLGTVVTGVVNYDFESSAVAFYYSAPSGNFTINFRGSASVPFATFFPGGDFVSATFIIQQGATTFRPTALQIDGTTAGVQVVWAGGAGQPVPLVNTYSVYTFAIQHGGSSFTIFAAMTSFGA